MSVVLWKHTVYTYDKYIRLSSSFRSSSLLLLSSFCSSWWSHASVLLLNKENFKYFTCGSVMMRWGIQSQTWPGFNHSNILYLLVLSALYWKHTNLYYCYSFPFLMEHCRLPLKKSFFSHFLHCIYSGAVVQQKFCILLYKVCAAL